MPRCIFCKSSSNSFSSEEHIVSSALGNMDHVLPKGIVCDVCNNVFSIKIEKPILESSIFTDIRARMKVPNRRGKIPAPVQHSALNLPDKRLLARYIGKIGLEALAAKALEEKVPNWEQEIIDHETLNTLRNFVRYNQPINIEWPFSYRTLYPINAVFNDGKENYEVLHEYCLLYTETFELYICVALFGVEFCMNLGGPVMDGFDEWLKVNGGTSPLYPSKKNK